MDEEIKHQFDYEEILVDDGLKDDDIEDEVEEDDSEEYDFDEDEELSLNLNEAADKDEEFSYDCDEDYDDELLSEDNVAFEYDDIDFSNIDDEEE